MAVAEIIRQKYTQNPGGPLVGIHVVKANNATDTFTARLVDAAINAQVVNPTGASVSGVSTTTGVVTLAGAPTDGTFTTVVTYHGAAGGINASAQG